MDMQNRYSGFSLIELMVAVAILAIVAALAAPALQTFVSRSNMRGISADFTLAIQRARTEAINRNQCVGICMSSATDATSPTCTSSGQNWGVGWIVFSLPNCGAVGTSTPSSTATPPEVILFMHEGVNSRFQLNNSASVPSVVFDARGASNVSTTRFDLIDTQAQASEAAINRTFCMDRAGRLQIKAYGDACP